MGNVLSEPDEIIIKCSLEKMVKAFFKDYEIIWHDPNVNSEENQHYLAQLELLCKVKAFTDWKKAEDYIKAAKTICHVITSGTNGELFVKEIFSNQNVPNILTFCRDNKDHHTIWTNNYEKVLCTETKIEGVISQVQKNLSEWHKETSSLKLDLPAFAPIFDNSDKSKMNRLHHYLKVIPRFHDRAQARTDFLNLSKGVYTDEENRQLISYFERTYIEYHKETILKWYTRQSFLYKVINNCLRIATSDSMQYCRFLLKDVERAIKDQYQKKSKEFSGLLYRGAYLSAEEWSSLKANKNREIEMHGFLSVSKEKKVALNFVKGDPSKKVFITIIVPKGPNEEEQGFAEVEEFSEFPKEKEVLFNVRSRFTVLETEEKQLNGSPFRHLILLYGAQSLRKYMTEKNPVREISFADIGNIPCSGCRVPIVEIAEKMFFISLEKRIYFCKKCLDDAAAPFISIPITENILPRKIKGCILANKSQTKIPFYGYKCSKCGSKNQKRYFVCTDCGGKERKWCQNCFGNALDCTEMAHNIILESSPFSFWCEKMSQDELTHLKYQNDVVAKSNHVFQQAEMYFGTQEYEKAIEYYSVFIQQNESQGNDDEVASSYSRLGSIYDAQQEYGKAFESFIKALEMRKSVYGESHSSVASSYGDIGSIYERQGEYKKALEYHLKSQNILKSLVGENHPEVASISRNVGLIYLRQGEYEKALEYYLKSLYITESVYEANHPKIAGSYSSIGLLYFQQGKYEKALEYLLKCLKMKRLVHGEDHPDVAASYSNVALVYEKQGENKKALEYHLKALDISKSVYGKSHPDDALYFNRLGIVYEGQGEYGKALEYFLKSLDIQKSVYGESHPNVSFTLQNIGAIYEAQGEYKKALECHLASLSIRKSVHGENHPDVATSYNHIGHIKNLQGEYKKALEYLLKALDILKSVHGENHPETAYSLNRIGLVYSNQFQDKDALDTFFKSLEIFKSTYGNNHPDVATTYSNIGNILSRQAEYEKALEYHLKALKIEQSVSGENHPSTAISLNNIGSIYQEQGEHEKALEYVLKALEIFESVHGENHPDLAAALNNIGYISYKQGEHEKALEYYLKSLKIMKSIYGENHPNIVASALNIGLLYYDMGLMCFEKGEADTAIEYLLKSLDIRKAVYGETHPDVNANFCYLGLVSYKQGESSKALEYLLKFLDISKTLNGENHPEIIVYESHISKIVLALQSNP